MSTDSKLYQTLLLMRGKLLMLDPKADTTQCDEALTAHEAEQAGDTLTAAYMAGAHEARRQLRAEQEQAGEAVASSDGIVSAIDAVEFRREQYGLNCNQWSAILGMLPSHYSEFIHGKRPLPVSAIAQAYAYGVPADALLQQRPTRGASDIDRRLAELEKLRAHGITKEPKT